MIATTDAVRSSASVAVASLIVRRMVVLLWAGGVGGGDVGRSLTHWLAIRHGRPERWPGFGWEKARGSWRRCVHHQLVGAMRLAASRLRVVAAIAASAGATSSLHRAASSLSAAEPRGRSLRQAVRRRRGPLRAVSSRPG